MGHKNRTILVTATDDPANPGGVKFSMAGFGVTGEEIICKKDDMKHPMKEDESHKVVFELVNDSTVAGLRFADEDEVMWVGLKNQLGSCPSAGSKQDKVVRATDVSDDGEQLTVKNYNREPDQGKYKFALNFVDADGGTHCYDPTWDERNGGQRR